jgi:hypothetical protein
VGGSAGEVERQKQIPFGDDNQKGNGKNNSKDRTAAAKAEPQQQRQNGSSKGKSKCAVLAERWCGREADFSAALLTMKLRAASVEMTVFWLEEAKNRQRQKQNKSRSSSRMTTRTTTAKTKEPAKALAEATNFC